MKKPTKNGFKNFLKYDLPKILVYNFFGILIRNARRIEDCEKREKFLIIMSIATVLYVGFLIVRRVRSYKRKEEKSDDDEIEIAMTVIFSWFLIWELLSAYGSLYADKKYLLSALWAAGGFTDKIL